MGGESRTPLPTQNPLTQQQHPEGSPKALPSSPALQLPFSPAPALHVPACAAALRSSDEARRAGSRPTPCLPEKLARWLLAGLDW